MTVVWLSFIIMVIFWIIYVAVKPRKNWARNVAYIFASIFGLAEGMFYSSYFLLVSSFILMIAFWITHGVGKTRKNWAKITAITFTIIHFSTWLGRFAYPAL